MTFFAQVSQIISSPMILFTASRYLRYTLLVVRGIIIAKYLGPHFFGIWGFVILVRQYLTHASLGIPAALNVVIATKDNEEQVTVDRTIQAAITLSVATGLVLLMMGLGINFSGVTLFERFEFNQYVIQVVVIAALFHLEQAFINTYRVHGRLGRIALAELIAASLPLASVFLVPQDILIHTVLVAMIIAGVVNNLILIIKAPFKVGFTFHWPHLTHLILVGIPLQLRIVSQYLITVVGRTIVSIFYSVEVLGFYSLADRITFSIFLGLQAVSWVFYPTVLSKVRMSRAREEIQKTVGKVTRFYVTAVFMIVFLANLLVPLLFLYLDEYIGVAPAVQILLFTQAFASLSLAYVGLAIAWKKRLTVAMLNVVAFSTVAVLALVVAYIGLDFVWVAVATMAGTVVGILLKIRLGLRLLDLPWRSIWEVLPLGALTAMCIAFIGTIVGQTTLFNLLALGIFGVTNRHNLRDAWQFMHKFIHEKRDLRVVGAE